MAEEKFGVGETVELPKVTKRVRRKAMPSETYARFCNRAAEAISTLQAEFDPNADEMERMLRHLANMVAWLTPITKRRTS